MNAFLSPTLPLSGRWRAIWRLAFITLVIAGFLLTGIGYRHGLPFVDTPDEVTLWTIARAHFDSRFSLFQPDQPPALIYVSEVIQRLQIAAGDPFINISGTIEIMRFMSVICFTVTLAVIILLGRRLAGPLAGLVAGLLWAVLPLSNELSKLATHNLWMSMFFILSIAVGVEGWYRKSLWWLAASLAFGILSALFKWQGGAAIAVSGLALLSFWKTERRKMMIGMTVFALILLVLAYWAVFIHGIFEGNSYLPGTKPQRPTADFVITNLLYMATTIAPALLYAVLPLAALVIIGVVPELRKRLYGQMGVWSFLIVIIGFSAILSFQGAPVYPRHYLAGYTLLAILAGMAVVFILHYLPRLSERLRVKWVGSILAVVLLMVVGVAIVQQAQKSIQITRDAIRIDRRNMLADWAKQTPTDGSGILIINADTAVALQTLYGYRGKLMETPYNENWVVRITADQITPETFTTKNIRYYVSNPNDPKQQLKLPATSLLRSPTGEQYSGPEWELWYVGELPPVTTKPLAEFGNEISLRGAQFTPQAVCPGQTVEMQMLWSAMTPPAYYYSVFVHLFSEKTGELSEPINGDQPASGNRPTISWTNPAEILVGPKQSWTVRNDLPIGQYDIRVGIYEPSRDRRLSLPDGKDEVIIGQLTVRDCQQ